MNDMARMGPIVFGAKSDRQMSGRITRYMEELAYIEKEVWDETDTVQAIVAHFKNSRICKHGKDCIVARAEMSDALDALHDDKVPLSAAGRLKTRYTKNTFHITRTCFYYAIGCGCRMIFITTPFLNSCAVIVYG